MVKAAIAFTSSVCLLVSMLIPFLIPLLQLHLSKSILFISLTFNLKGKPFSSQSDIKDRKKDMVNMEAKAKWQCPKCGVGLPYNPTYKIEGLCFTCRVYEDSDRLLKGYRLNKRTIT